MYYFLKMKKYLKHFSFEEYLLTTSGLVMLEIKSVMGVIIIFYYGAKKVYFKNQINS